MPVEHSLTDKLTQMVQVLACCYEKLEAYLYLMLARDNV